MPPASFPGKGSTLFRKARSQFENLLARDFPMNQHNDFAVVVIKYKTQNLQEKIIPGGTKQIPFEIHFAFGVANQSKIISKNLVTFNTFSEAEI